MEDYKKIAKLELNKSHLFKADYDTIVLSRIFNEIEILVPIFDLIFQQKGVDIKFNYFKNGQLKNLDFTECTYFEFQKHFKDASDTIITFVKSN